MNSTRVQRVAQASPLPVAALRRATHASPLLAAILVVGSARAGLAQCFPPENSNEALLLAHYEVPIAFSSLDRPIVLQPWQLAVSGELAGVPAPSASLSQTSYCYVAKQEGTHLSPVLPRVRLAVGLPAGFAIEGSYVPPITVDQAQPNLGSLALSYTRALLQPSDGGPSVIFGARADGTVGRVVGPVTCPASALQQTDAGEPCYGTKPSSDAFYPNSAGLEANVGAATHSGLGAFFGLGYGWAAPHFRVGFTDLEGSTDHTLVEVDLHRVSVFGGVSVPIVHGLDAAAEVYSVPADLTTWRLSVRYLIP